MTQVILITSQVKWPSLNSRLQPTDQLQMPKRSGPWHCYMLHGAGAKGRNYTYVGKTNHMKRRLRQHNGKISGGARRTHAHRPHRPFCIVSGFPSERAVLQFEWAMKHRRKRGSRGRSGRVRTIEHLFSLGRWTRTAPWMAHLQLTVRSVLSRAEYVAMLPKSDNVARDAVRNTCNVTYMFGQTLPQMLTACSPRPRRPPTRPSKSCSGIHGHSKAHP